jgi:DNA-binding transcriptional ArsR family regulator
VSIHLSSVVWRTALGGPSIKAVAMKLADCAHDDGTNIYPSVATIARETEISPRTVQYAIRDLITLGILVLVEEGGKGRKSTTVYRFDLDVLYRLHTETINRWRAEDEAKGAKSAPLKTPLRVQPASAKGAKSARKGAMAAPEPLEPSIEPQRAHARESDFSDFESEVQAHSERLSQAATISDLDAAWKAVKSRHKILASADFAKLKAQANARAHELEAVS